MGRIRPKYYRYQLASLLMTACFSQAVTADFIGVYAGAGSWYQTTEGQMNHLGTDADMEKEYGFESEFSNFAYVAVEHPFPFIPNARINRYSLENKASRTVSAASEFTFAGTAYTSGTAISTALRWDEADTLLYYEFLDNIISFDLGLGVKKVDAEFSVTAGGATNTLRIEETLPIAYVMAGVHLPGTGISIIIEQTQSFHGDIEIVQSNSKISYEIAYMLGIEAGYRTSTAKLDELANVSGEVEFSGPFVNLLFHF